MGHKGRNHSSTGYQTPQDSSQMAAQEIGEWVAQPQHCSEGAVIHRVLVHFTGYLCD